MTIDRLRLVRFRNHFATCLEPLGRPQVLVTGPNGAGKTSLLEALHLLATGIGIKTRRDREFVGFGAEGYRVDARLGSGVDLALRFQSGGRRQALVDDRPLARSGELLGRLRLTLLQPNDLDLVDGHPASRRRFLDMMLCQGDAGYLEALRRYRRALAHCHRVAPRQSRVAAPFLRIMAEQLPRIGQARESWGAELHRRVGAMVSQFGSPWQVTLEYQPAIDGRCTNWPERARRSLEENLKLQAAGAPPVWGPHRDELRLKLNGTSLRQFGSQGEKRLIALLMKLAAGQILAADGGPTLLMVDDVLGELDAARREGLVSLLERFPGQVWVAGTDLKNLEERWQNGVKFAIKSGSVQGVKTP